MWCVFSARILQRQTPSITDRFVWCVNIRLLVRFFFFFASSYSFILTESSVQNEICYIFKQSVNKSSRYNSILMSVLFHIRYFVFKFSWHNFWRVYKKSYEKKNQVFVNSIQIKTQVFVRVKMLVFVSYFFLLLLLCVVFVFWSDSIACVIIANR